MVLRTLERYGRLQFLAMMTITFLIIRKSIFLTKASLKKEAVFKGVVVGL